MPPRGPLNPWSERPDYAGSSHRSGDLVLRPPRPLSRQQSPGSWAFLAEFTHAYTVWQPQRQWWSIVLQGARSPSLPLTRPESSSNWKSLSPWSPIVEPITRDRAQRPATRDSTGRQDSSFPDVFHKLCPTLGDPLRDSSLWAALLVGSGTEFDLRSSVLRGLVLSVASRLSGSCKCIAINTIRLGGKDGRDDTTWVSGSNSRSLQTSPSSSSSLPSSPVLRWDSPHSHSLVAIITNAHRYKK